MVEFLIPEPEHREGTPYSYMGWEFSNRTWINDEGESGATLISFHRLSNPESETLVYAFKNYKPGHPHLGIDYAAAWLIAHWFEHYMDKCNCVGHPPSRFRYGFIEGIR